MRKLFATFILLVTFGSLSTTLALAAFQTFSIAATFPSIVPGSFAPHSQTPTMPSVDTDGPRCFDSTWGACDGTQHCIAPTSGTPLESCQPPQELVPTSVSWTGGVATIHYFSAAAFTYTAATSLIISGATQDNWNTPTIQASALSFNPTDSTNCSGSQSATLTVVNTFAANPFIVGKQIYINGLTNSNGNTQFQSFAWTTGNPNGSYQVKAIGGSSGSWTVTYCTHSTVAGTAVANQDGSFGTLSQPWTVSTSACVGTACTVTFANPNTCTGCITGSTQIAAGQSSDLILAWHFGEEVAFKTYVSGDTITVCVIAKSIGPVQWVAFSADGGPFVKATFAAVNDPRGAGQSGLSITAVHPYCAQVKASAFAADGEHKINVIGCPVVGYCGQLTSALAIDGSASSTYWTANNHEITDFKFLGITNSFDSAFPNYDWRYNTTVLGNTTTGITGATATTSGSQITISYTPNGSIPTFLAGQTVGLSSFTAASSNQCGVSAGSHSGTFPTSGVLTLTLTGTCNFPVGSTVNIAGITATTSGGAPSNFAWNGNGVLVQSPAVNCVSSAGSCTLNVPGLSTAPYVSGGTVTANLNGNCVIASAGSGSIVCPSTVAAVTTATGGAINAFGNTFCAVGGNGDNPAPYTPYTISSTNTSPFGSQMQTNAFQMIAAVSNPATCQAPENSTGCAGQAPCGRLPTGTETIWVWRRDAGIDERKASGAASGMLNNSALYFFTNVNSSIMATRAHVDSWNGSAVAGNAGGVCNESSPVPAGSALTSYSGTYCSNTRSAMSSLAAAISNVGFNADQTLSNSGGCLVFTATANNTSPALYVGEPIELANGYDTNSSPQLVQWGLYWIQSKVSAAVTLATTPGGSCINETASLVFGGTSNVSGHALLQADISFDSVLFECNQSVSPVCSNSNPELYINGVSGIVSTNLKLFARAGYVNFDPNTANGATQSNVGWINGDASWFGGSPSQGGRIRYSVGSYQSELQLTSAVSVGPTLPIITSAAANVSLGSCTVNTNVHQCETITFPAHLNPSTQVADGATYQAPTSSSPGQSLVISGLSPSAFNCGTSVASPCLGSVTTANAAQAGIASSSTTSVTFVNDAASGSATGTASIIPTNIVLEFAAGTFAYNASTNPNSLCAPSGVADSGSTAPVCLTATASGQYNGTRDGGFPFAIFGLGGQASSNTQLSRNSNCLPLASGFAGGANVPPASLTFATSITPAAKSGFPNDTMSLVQNITAGAASFNAFNSCGTGPFFFANSVFTPQGTVTDIWQDGTTYNGPIWSDYWQGTAGNPTGAQGASYITNSTRFNTQTAFDTSSYAWGSKSQYNAGICMNQAQMSVSINCLNAGGNVVPLSMGGGLNTDGTQYTPITGAWDITNTPTTCSGNPCINTSTRTIGVGTGDIPFRVASGWDTFITCGVTSMATVGNGTQIGQINLTYFDNSASPARVLLTSSPTGTCNLSNNPVVMFYDFRHIDFAFNTYNGDGPPSNGGSYNFWLHWMDYVEENTWCQPCGTTEGIFGQGANFWNIAYEDGGVHVNQAASSSSTFSFVGWALGGAGSITNTITRNEDVWGFFGGQGNGIMPPYTDVFFININGGVDPNFATTSSPQNAPTGQPDPSQTGWWSATYNTLNPFAGSAAVGGGPTNMAIYPTATRAVTPGTGVPATPSDPWPSSFLALPWYGATDSGLGSF